MIMVERQTKVGMESGDGEVDEVNGDKGSDNTTVGDQLQLDDSEIDLDKEDEDDSNDDIDR